MFNKELFDIEKQISSKTSIKFGLLEGYGGVSLFYFYLARLTQDSKFHDRGMALLSECIEKLDASNGSYCNGMSGVGQLLNHLVEEDFVEIPDEIFEDLDYHIQKWTVAELERKNLDLLYGASGSLLYLFQRSKIKHELKIFLEECFCKIDSFAIKSEGKAFWQNWDFENNCLNTEFCDLGIAHGQISIIYVLSKLYSVTKFSGGIELIESGLRFLQFASSHKKNGEYKFPYFYDPVKPSKFFKSRLGWCYGDLATSVILGQIIKKNHFSDYLIWIAAISKNNIHLTKQDATCESSLCHGFAGCSLLFSKLCEEFPDCGIEEIAKSYENKIDTSLNSDNIDMLDGLSGVGLFLISQKEKKYIKWQDLILLDSQ